MKGGMERVRSVARPKEGLNLRYVTLGVVAAFLLAFVLSGLIGLVMYQGWLSETYSPLVMSIVSFTSLFFGGIYAGSRAGTAGWAHGALTGLAYIVIVSIIGLLVFDQLAPVLVLAGRLGLGVGLGAVGGTVGINLK
ncbi:MAG: TIGR04086 family membrane protein [Alicyclobacillus sp.]|nr:TIGR04086 family membrane protein [Alicyclobacillus sp.]